MKHKRPQGYRYAFAHAFSCLKDQCPSTCCKGWDIPCESRTVEAYRAYPEAFEAITIAESGWQFKRSPTTGACTQLKNGLCSLQTRFGEAMLSDTCALYPRLTRKEEGTITQSLTISCPEAARLLLEHPKPFKLIKATLPRLPSEIKNFLPSNITRHKAHKVRMALLHFIEQSITADTALRYIAMQLTHIENDGSLLTLAKTLPATGGDVLKWNVLTPVRLLLSLGIKLHASKHASTDLHELFHSMLESLALDYHSPSGTIKGQPPQQDLLTLLQERHFKDEAVGRTLVYVEHCLKRYAQAQILNSGFPYGGFGETIEEKFTIISVRYATIRLALLCHLLSHQGQLSTTNATHIIYTLSRFFDHIPHAMLSLAIYKEMGWLGAAGLQMIWEDAA